MDDDIDDLLNEVETKFCASGPSSCKSKSAHNLPQNAVVKSPTRLVDNFEALTPGRLFVGQECNSSIQSMEYINMIKLAGSDWTACMIRLGERREAKRSREHNLIWQKFQTIKEKNKQNKLKIEEYKIHSIII